MYKHKNKYIYDVLYGPIYLPDYAWHVIFTPEVQRLRELRLCNINSLCLTGGANVNRFEHTLGTCHLALVNLENGHYNLSIREKQLFIIASIFHDVYNSAFGHSLEYVEGVKPENMFYYAATGKKYESYTYKAASFEPIYFGRLEELYSSLKVLKFTDSDIKTIGDYINGKGKLGKILSGSIDLDNIDNVCRLAYHIGLFKDKELPIKLAKSIWIENDKLRIEDKNLSLINDWIKVREQLYKLLLLNPEEFSAKYMLTEAFELFQKQENKNIGFAWYDVDYQLLEKLSRTSSEVSNIVSSLMCGQLYGCFAIYTTTKLDRYKEFLNLETREHIENQISLLIKPEVIEEIELSELIQQIIRGIKGISYNSDEKKLKINYELKESTVKLLIDNELYEHKDLILTMREKAINKFNLYKIKSPNIGIHPILDYNKTNRKVTVFTTEEKSQDLGFSSKELHLSILLKNKEYTNIDIFDDKSNLKPENIENIKNTIKDFLSHFLNDDKINEHELYSEIIYG